MEAELLLAGGIEKRMYETEEKLSKLYKKMAAMGGPIVIIIKKRCENLKKTYKLMKQQLMQARLTMEE